jgi:ParB-like chromosome segregation protein Spo0J
MSNHTASEAARKPEAAKSWRDILPVHPAADLFPMMLGGELRTLADDIRAHNLAHRPVVQRAPTGGFVLLDGRNRLDALELLGAEITCPSDLFWTIGDDVDPYEYVISANIHRRHLTTQQKRELIAKLIQATPDKSDRQIAQQTKTSPTTVGSVRSKLEQAGGVSKLDTRTDTEGRHQPAHRPPKQTDPVVQAAVERAFARSEEMKRRQISADADFGRQSARIMGNAMLSEQAWRLAEPAARTKFVRAVGLRSLFEAAPGRDQDAFWAWLSAERAR